MHSDVHPLVAALVIALTAVAIATWMWGMEQAASIGGPAELRTDPNGHLYIQIQNKLVEHDANGVYVKTHDLSSLGVEQFIGAYDFFANGDILLRRGPDPRSFFDNIRAFQRKANVSSLQPATADSGLFRCDLHARQCSRFGDAGVDFKAAFGVAIDHANGAVFFSDTSRHQLLKYTVEGELLAGPVDGFKFPNQLLLNEHLYVADTNNHRISVVNAATQNFATEIASEFVVPIEAVNAEQRWPSHMIRVGDAWWVNNMQHSMDLGGLYIFDADWHFHRKVALPIDADPISLVMFRGEVLVSDWNNDAVYRISTSGEYTGDFESTGLNEVIKESEGRRSTYLWVSYSGVALLALVIGGLFVRALVVTVSPPADSRRGAVDLNAERAPLYMEPTQAAASKAWKTMRVAGVLLVVALMTCAVFVLALELPTAKVLPLLALTVGIVPVFLLIAWASRENVNSAIRIEGGVLTLRNRAGRESSCPITEARYDKTIVATHEMAVFLGQPIAPLYDRDTLKNELFPRLKTARKMSPLQMQQLLLELRHPQAIVTLLAVFGLLLYAVWSIVGESA